MLTATRNRLGLATLLALSVLFIGVAVCVAAEQDDPHAKHRQMLQQKQPTDGASTSIAIPDRTLLNRQGDEVRLASDVIRDRIVVIDFVYTTCTTVCPVLSAILSQVQKGIGERLGKDVVLVSITVDPLRDTPDRMKDYASRLRAQDGWYWLTGSKQDIDDVLRAMGAYTANFEDHPSMILVGDGNSGEWSRFVGFPGANHLIQKIEELSAARSAQAAIGE